MVAGAVHDVIPPTPHRLGVAPLAVPVDWMVGLSHVWNLTPRVQVCLVPDNPVTVHECVVVDIDAAQVPPDPSVPVRT